MSRRRFVRLAVISLSLGSIMLPAMPATAGKKPLAPPFDRAETAIVHLICPPGACLGTVSADPTGALSMQLINQTSPTAVPQQTEQFGAAQVFVTHLLKKAAQRVHYRLVFHLDGLSATVDPDVINSDFESVVELDITTEDGGCCANSKVAHIFDHQPSGTLGPQDVIIELDWPDVPATLEPGPIELRVLLFGDVFTSAGLGGRAILDVGGTVTSLVAEITPLR